VPELADHLERFANPKPNGLHRAERRAAAPLQLPRVLGTGQGSKRARPSPTPRRLRRAWGQRAVA
jgi:hypothetical protein